MSELLQSVAPSPVLAEPFKIDLGCGKGKRPGFTGVDILRLEGVDITADLKKRWPFNDESVDEAHSSHYLEHLDGQERIHFWNELYRVLKVGAKATVTGPDWANSRAYGDPTHKYPPLADFHVLYLSKAWRESQAPHCDSRWVEDGFSCDFEAVAGHSWDPNHPEFLGRADDVRGYALRNFKNTAVDVIFSVTKRAP